MADEMNSALAAPPKKAALGFMLTNWDEVYRAATQLSKSGLVPEYLRGKPEDMLVILLQGSALGLDPVTSYQNIYVVKGRPFMASLLRQAIVRNSSECEYIRLVESTAKQATYETKRRGEAATRMTYTYAQAELSGITKQNPKYQTEPDVMLRRRCVSRLLDEVYPDILKGLGDRDEDPGALEYLQRADADAMARTAPPPTEVKKKPVPVKVETKPVEEAQYEEPLDETPPAPPEAPAQADDGAEHPAFVRLAEATTKSEIDEASKLGGAELPKGHPLRESFGKAVAERRRAIAQGGA